MFTVINNICWDIVRVEPNNINLYNYDGTITVGMTDTYNKIIYINNRLRGKFLRRVLIHELVHAWIYSYGFNLTRNQQEFICNFVADNSDDILSKADEIICTGYFRVAL